MNELKEQIIDAIDGLCPDKSAQGSKDYIEFLIDQYTAKKELEARLRGQLEIVRSANCIIQANEPAIDEIWFDLAYDSEIVPMRQDTMITYLKQEIYKITQLSSQLTNNKESK